MDAKAQANADEKEDKRYTIEDIMKLPEGQRAELINGRWYDMSAPSRVHQEIVMNLSSALHEYIKSNGGNCKVYPAPFAVFLNKDNRNYFEPDISVICDKSKLSDRGCEGAPDVVIEVASESTKSRDLFLKLYKYMNAGVKEYWVVDPLTNTVNCYEFNEKYETGGELRIYNFDEEIPFITFPELMIRVADYLK